MALTVVITARTAAVEPTDAATEFTTAGPFVFSGDDFGVGEFAHLMRLGPSGGYRHATNEKGRISVSAYPNTVYVDIAGTFRVQKDSTREDASVGYEEQ